MRVSRHLAMVFMASALAACYGARAEKPIPPVSQMDLSRYMGDWYVIASIPTRFEQRRIRSGGELPAAARRLDLHFLSLSRGPVSTAR